MAKYELRSDMGQHCWSIHLLEDARHTNRLNVFSVLYNSYTRIGQASSGIMFMATFWQFQRWFRTLVTLDVEMKILKSSVWEIRFLIEILS